MNRIIYIVYKYVETVCKHDSGNIIYIRLIQKNIIYIWESYICMYVCGNIYKHKGMKL